MSQVDAWPKDALFAPVATIPKDDTCQPGPLDLRPITVTSPLFASWASTRFRDLRERIARSVDESVIGGREGKQVQEAVWPLILELESAAESDIPVSAATFDASKFFDHMEWDETFSILRELSCGPLWRANNGLIQGCSLTLVAAMAIATVRAKFDRASTPEATLATVFDDWRMFVSGRRSVEQLERVLKRTRDYDASTGTVTNLKKTSCATRRPKSCGSVTHQSKQKLVPGCLPEKRPRELQNKRAGKTTRTALRVARLPPLFSREKKTKHVVFGGQSAIHLWDGARTTIESRQAQVGASGSQCFYQSHQHSKIEASAFFFVDQGTQGSPAAGWRSLWERVISFNSCGLATNLINAVHTLGGTWISPWTFEIHRHGRMELCGDEDRIWAHKIREAARLVRWRQVKRKNFPGVEDGIDTDT